MLSGSLRPRCAQRQACMRNVARAASLSHPSGRVTDVRQIHISRTGVFGGLAGADELPRAKCRRCRGQRYSAGSGQRRRPQQFDQRSQRRRQCGEGFTAAATQHGGSRRAFRSGGDEPAIAKLGSGNPDSAAARGGPVAARARSAARPHRYAQRKTSRSEDEHLQGVLGVHLAGKSAPPTEPQRQVEPLVRQAVDLSGQSWSRS